MPEKTHREVKQPQISARALADFMAASETAKRTIVRGCKYQSRARVVQHTEAKLAVGKFLRSGAADTAPLAAKAAELKARLSDTDFDRDLFDHNADYINRFVAVFGKIDLPDAERMPPGPVLTTMINGVKVTTELHLRLRRLTKTNKIRSGAAMLRYAKGKPLSEAIADWQAAFLFGWLTSLGSDDGSEPERPLCLTIDAQSGHVHPAPGDAMRRYKHMMAACETIAERWPNIAPPPGAGL